MKKRFWLGLVAALAIFALAVPGAMAGDIELAKKSTLEEIIKRGELRVGFEAGYRTQTIELDDVDDTNANLDFKGPFIGAYVKF